MAIEKLLEEVGKELVKETLDPNEKLLKESIGLSEAKEVVKIAPDVESAVKISELDAAKNYFTGIGDTEKLKALEDTDVAKKEEALMEAKEKSAEVREAAQVEDKFNANPNVSFKRVVGTDGGLGGRDTQIRRGCERTKNPAYG